MIKVTQSLMLRLTALLFVVLLCGCASQNTQFEGSKAISEFHTGQQLSVPFYPQEKFQCGPAALAMLLSHSGVDVLPESLTDSVYVPGRKGSFQVELLATARTYQRIALVTEATITSLLNWVNAGQPVLVLQNRGLAWYPNWHYGVVTGFNTDDQTITLHSGLNENYTIPIKLFERTWARAGSWGMVALQPGNLPLAENENRYFQAIVDFDKYATAESRELAWTGGLNHWPQSKHLLMGMGNFYHEQKQYEKAKLFFEKVVALYPNYAPAYNNLADVLIRQQQPVKAVSLATKAISLHTENQSLYINTLEEARSLQQKDWCVNQP